MAVSVPGRMNVTPLSSLDGKIVLVRSAVDQRNPPTGIRGTLRVMEDAISHRPVVHIELDFPQMFTTRAHHRTVTLTEAEIAELLQSDDSGTFSVTLPDRLDPEAPPGNE